MPDNEDIPQPLEVTDSAVNKVQKLLEEEENPLLKLRVFVTGGGCSGFQYGFSFDEKQNDGDLAIEKGGITVVVDPLSIQYLMGSKVDYTEGLQGARFIVDNPNAETTCGCGSSFSL
jgi:iron-sulfur cluster insertion protein